MKEITRIHLAKIPYEIELDAKKQLEKYLNELSKFADEEVLKDVEIRITEILAESGVHENGIIARAEAEKIRAQIGEPEVFKGEDFEESSNEASKTNENSSKIKKTYFEKLKGRKLYRIRENSIIDGVCAGLAEYFGIETTWMRIFAFISIFLTGGFTILLYVILAIIVPTAKSANDILRLRGEDISADAIRKINEEFDFEKTKLRNKRVLSILGILLGIGSIAAATAGVAMLVAGNFALQETFSNGSALGINDNYRLLLVILSNLAGAVFVIFCLTLTSVGFSRKFSRMHFVALMMCLALGASSAVGFGTIAWDSTKKANDKISKSFKLSTVKIKTEDLSKITKIENATNFEIEYIVSDQRKIEIGEYKIFEQDLAKNTKFEFNGDSLRIFSNQARKAWTFGGDAYKIRIYGPELSRIVTDWRFEYHLSKTQTTPLEVVSRNVHHSDFDIRGTGSVQDLKVFERDNYGNLVVKKEEATDEN